MARKPVPGSDDGQWGTILNEFLDVTLNGTGALRSDVVSEANLEPSVRSKLNSAGGELSDGSVTTAKLANKAVTEAKLADAVTTKLNAPATIADDAIAEAKLSGGVRTKLNATSTIADDSIAESKLNQAVKDKLNGVSGGSGVADNSVTTPKIADNAVTTAKLASTSVTDAKIAAGVSQSKITNLTTDLADKASVSSVAGKADASHTHTLAELSNVTTTGATSGQALVFQGSQWAPATVTSGGGGGTGSPLVAVQKASNYTANAGEWVIYDTTASGYDMTLPAPTNGAWVKVKKMTNNVNAVVVYPPSGSGQISAGTMTSNTIAVNNYGQSIDFFADGDQWHLA